MVAVEAAAAAVVVPDSTIISLYLRQITNKCQINLVTITSPLQTIANLAEVSIKFLPTAKMCLRLSTNIHMYSLRL